MPAHTLTQRQSLEKKPSVSVSTQKQYNLPVVLLENDLLRLEIFPTLGAKIYRLIHKPTDTNLLWNNSHIEPREVPLGSNYDDNFSGGWDELFPNDAPGMVEGKNLPDHGELWAQPWDVEIHRERSSATIHLTCLGTVTTTHMEKWVTLKAGSNVIHFRHKLTNLGAHPLKFLWKLHPAMAISPDHRIDVPGTTVEPVHPDWSRIAGAGPHPWPLAPSREGSSLDLRRIPPAQDGTKEFVYVRGLKEGWCAITDTRKKLGFGLVFPKEVFTSVWLFMTFGGWRGHYTAILEPCTAYPKDLNTAIRTGNCGRLASGRSLEVEVKAVVYEGKTQVRHIDSSGKVS
ncbi:MAG: DUF5107 domain-containing protein [Elusimicrobia bacterium]|nr:DUF5107 domain-containing protein [Elusimicrobiota bacterium]